MKRNTTGSTTGIIDMVAFGEITQRVKGKLTAPVFCEAVPGRVSLHDGIYNAVDGKKKVRFSDGCWATFSMITYGRVLCTNGCGHAEICDTVEKAVDTICRLYQDAVSARYWCNYMDMSKIHFLRLATPGEHPSVTDAADEREFHDGNLLLFSSNGNHDCLTPDDSHAWYDVSMTREGAICSTSEGATMHCYNPNQVIRFLWMQIAGATI